MKKLATFTAAAMIAVFGLVGAAQAATEASDSPSTHVVDSDGSALDFNSAFCLVGVPNDPVTISLFNSAGDAAGLRAGGQGLP